MEPQEAFDAVVKEVLAIRKQRKGKYGNTWTELGLDGNFFMIKNKFIRLEMNHKSKDESYESAKDTLKDLINYSLFQLAMLKLKEEGYFGENVN